MDITEIRTALIEIAHLMAQRVVAQVLSTELQHGNLVEEQEIGGSTWKITAAYMREQDVVIINGHPVIAQHPIFAVFGQMVGNDAVESMQTNAESAFTFVLPASWLPESADKAD